jgi:hypothetical protein
MDYAEHVGQAAPVDLVPDPPNVDGCASSARSLAAVVGKKPPRAKLAQRCRELILAIRRQALGFLIEHRWRVNEARRYDIVPTRHEVSAALVRQQQAQSDDVKKRRQESSADERYEAALNVVNARLLKRFSHEGSGGGLNSAFLRMASTMPRRRAATTCEPGYIVAQCRGYRPTPEPESSSAAVLLERTAAGSY